MTNSAKPPASQKEVRRIVALGRKHAATAFPNPGQTNCPGDDVLRAMAYRDRRLAEPLPISHVASCSPCFRAYSRHRRNWKVRTLILTSAGLLAILGCLWGTALMVQEPRPKPNLGIPVKPFPADSDNASPAVPLSSQAKPPAPPLLFTVDLGKFSPLRGNDGPPPTRIQLPARLLRVQFLLPIGFEPDEYRVRLTRLNEVLLDVQRTGGLRTGATAIDVPMDLAHQEGYRFTLSIMPVGGRSREFEVEVLKP
jgi:hypothetical protein